MSAFDMEDRLYSLSANGKVAELKGLTSLSKTNVNASNERGWTAMMFAARNGHEDVVRLLLQQGAKSDKTNALGQTAYDIASFWNHQSVMATLGSTKSVNAPQEPVHFFTVKHLDRASDLRKDAASLKKILLTSLDTRLIVFVDTFPLLLSTDKAIVLRMFTYSELKGFIDVDDSVKSELVFLGNRITDDGGSNGGALFAVKLTRDNYEKLRAAFPDDNMRVLEKIRDAFVLDADQAALAGLAHSIFDWHSRYTYCPTCGCQTQFSDAGYKRKCTNQSCLNVKEIKNTSYMRLDPTIIVAVTSADRSRLLLARGRKFLPKMWSCLAGFMEPGESIEDACRREVFEESGVKVGCVSYHSSQPWPFPTQLMIGLVGQATSDKILVDKSELDDARWFTRSEVVKMMMRSHPEGYFVPPHQAIAHHLIKTFLHDSTSKI